MNNFHILQSYATEKKEFEDIFEDTKKLYRHNHFFHRGHIDEDMIDRTYEQYQRKHGLDCIEANTNLNRIDSYFANIRLEKRLEEQRRTIETRLDTHTEKWKGENKNG